jgi:hypothetical protein
MEGLAGVYTPKDRASLLLNNVSLKICLQAVVI